MLDQALLGAHHVADRDRREVGAPGFVEHGPVRQFPIAERAGAAHAAAENIGADDEEAVRVDRPPGADHRIPPAWFAGDRMLFGDILIAGQRMADQYRV